MTSEEAFTEIAQLIDLLPASISKTGIRVRRLVLLATSSADVTPEIAAAISEFHVTFGAFALMVEMNGESGPATDYLRDDAQGRLRELRVLVGGGQ